MKTNLKERKLFSLSQKQLEAGIFVEHRPIAHPEDTFFFGPSYWGDTGEQLCLDFLPVEVPVDDNL